MLLDPDPAFATCSDDAEDTSRRRAIMESEGSWEENQLWCPAVFGEELTTRLNNKPNLIATLLLKTKQGNLSITASSQRSEVTWLASITYSEGGGEIRRDQTL